MALSKISQMLSERRSYVCVGRSWGGEWIGSVEEGDEAAAVAFPFMLHTHSTAHTGRLTAGLLLTLETNLGLGLVSLGASAKATETGMRTVLNLCCTKKLRIVSIDV